MNDETYNKEKWVIMLQAVSKEEVCATKKGVKISKRKRKLYVIVLQGSLQHCHASSRLMGLSLLSSSGL